MKRMLAGLAAVVFLVIAAPAGAWMVAHSNNVLNPTISPEQFRAAADGNRPAPGLPPVPVTVTLLPLPLQLDPRLSLAVTRAAQKWNVPGSALPLSVVVAPPSKSPASDWRSRYLEDDGRDTVEFVTAGWPDFWGRNVIAMTVPRLDPDGRIREADIFCNAVDFAWSILPEAGVDPLAPAGRRVVDTEAIMTHEFGHLIGLGHTQREWGSMWPWMDPRSTRARHLTSDDRAGLRFLYPATAADIPPADLWGFTRQAVDSFPDGACGSTYMTLTEATILYIMRSIPLPGPHDRVQPPDWPSPYHFCLLGSGITLPVAIGLADGATVVATATDAQALGSNFASGSLDDGSSVFPTLPDGVYDFFIQQADGGTGVLPQGMFVTSAANELPEAVLAARPLADVGKSVRLDGSASYDPESAPLTYRFELIESPAPAEMSTAGAEAVLTLPAPGVYVVRLVVNDGTVDSIADQEIIQAANFPDGDGDTGLAFGGCVAAPGAGGGAGLAWLLAPAAALLWRRKRVARTQDRSNH